MLSIERLVHADAGLVAQRRGVERERRRRATWSRYWLAQLGEQRALASALGSKGSIAVSCGEDHAVAVAAGDRGAGRGGEDVGDELGRRAGGGLAAGERAGLGDRAVEARGEVGEAEAALELGDVAVGELGQRVGGLVGGPVGGDAVADLGERDHRRRVDLVDAQGGEAAVGELDQVGLLAGLGLGGGVAELGVVGEAAVGLAVERERAELHHRLGGDLLEGGAAGDEVLDVGGIVGDLLLAPRRAARLLASSALASSKGVVLAAMIALIAVERRGRAGSATGPTMPGPAAPKTASRASGQSVSAATMPWSMSPGFRPRSAARASKSIVAGVEPGLGGGGLLAWSRSRCGRGRGAPGSGKWARSAS